MPGFFPCAWDAKEGKLWLEIDRFDTDFLSVESLAAGVGSNDIGLDRGQLGGSHVVRFTRVGPKVLLIERNLRYRAVSDNADERTALDQAFAQSTLWGYEPLSTETQRAALAAVAQTWQPAFLTLPDKVIAAIPPLPPGYERDRELFDPHTGLVFDPLAAAESWVNAVLDLLFNPQRLSRIVEQNARGKSALTLPEVFDAVLKTGQIDARQSPYEQELARMVERQGLEHLFRVAANPEAQQQVCAEALGRIRELQAEATRRASADPGQQAQRAYLLFHIESFLRNSKEYQAPKPARIPDGSPIGCGAADFLGAIGD